MRRNAAGGSLCSEGCRNILAELTPGGRWRFVTDDLERLLASGEVLVVDPPYRFEQSFEAADLDDPPSKAMVFPPGP